MQPLPPVPGRIDPYRDTLQPMTVSNDNDIHLSIEPVQDNDIHLSMPYG